MADYELKYCWTATEGDGSTRPDGSTWVEAGKSYAFTSVNAAKTKLACDSNWNHSLGTQTLTLEDSNKRLVLVWAFTKDTTDDMKTVHDNIKDGSWGYTYDWNSPSIWCSRDTSNEYLKAHGSNV